MQMSGVGHNMVQCQSMRASNHNQESVQQSTNNVNQSTPQTNSLNQSSDGLGQTVDVRI